MGITAQENLTAWKLFRELVHYGEITTAANALDIDAGNASRLLTALERDLGFAVFDRTKRPFVLTREGKQLITNVETLLEGERNLKNLYRRVQKGENVIRILLGICTDSDPSFLFSLIEEYAQIDPSLEICLIDRLGLEDVQNGAVHLAYIPYLAKRQSVLCVPVTTVFMVSVASPVYLERLGRPKTPQDLKNHVALQRNDPGYPVTTGLWKHNYYQAIEPKKVWYLDNHIALRAAIEGKGIALDLPFSLTEGAIKDGSLVPTLNGWHRQCWHYSLVCKYETLHKYSNLGNFMEWFALRLQNFENLQWRSGYKLCHVDFPIFTPDGAVDETL